MATPYHVALLDRLARAIASEVSAAVRLRRGHRRPITALSFAQGGELVWTADEEGRIVGWDSRVGAARHELRCESTALALAASCDGGRLAVGRLEGPPVVYELPALASAASEPPVGARREGPVPGATLLAAEGAADSAAAVAWSPDGELLATGVGDYTASRFPILLWDSGGRLVQRLEGHRFRVRALAWSPDGELLASGSDDDSVALWRVATGELVARCALSADVVALGWCLDGSRLFAGAYDVVSELDRSGARVGGWQGIIVRSLAICPDGQHIALAGLRYGGPGALEIRTTAGSLVHQQLGGDDVAAVAYLPDGQLVAASGAAAQLYWGPCCRLELADPARPPIAVGGAAERLLVGGADGRLRVVTPRDPCERWYEVRAGHWVSRVGVSPVRRTVALASVSGEGKLIDADSGALVAPLSQEGEQWALAWSPDGSRFVIGGYDGLLTIRDGATGGVVHEIRLDGVRFQCAAFSADGERLLVGATDGLLRIWDARTAEGLANQRCSRGMLCALAVSPDGQRLATGGEDGRLRLYAEATGKRLGELEGPRLAVNDVRFSGDGQRLLAASGDGAIYLCRVDPPALVRKLEGHEGIVAAASFWLDDRLVSAGIDGQLIVWHEPTGDRLATLHHIGDQGWLVTAGDGRYDVAVAALGAVMVEPEARRVGELWGTLVGR